MINLSNLKLSFGKTLNGNYVARIEPIKIKRDFNFNLYFLSTDPDIACSYDRNFDYDLIPLNNVDEICFTKPSIETVVNEINNMVEKDYEFYVKLEIEELAQTLKGKEYEKLVWEIEQEAKQNFIRVNDAIYMND